MTINDALLLAVQRHQAGDFAGAEGIYRRILLQEPNHADALHLLGVMAHQRGENRLALELIGRAIAIKPGTMEYHFNLGLAGNAMGHHAEAIESFSQAASLPSPNSEMLIKLALELIGLRQWETALLCVDRVLASEPANAAAVELQARAAFDRGDFKKAKGYLRRAVGLRPDVALLHWNLGRVLLALGEFEEGWEEIEWQQDNVEAARHPRYTQPKWDGGDIAGGTLLVHAGGGMGDALHFVRYVPMLRGRAGRVILECHESQVELFGSVAGVDQVIARDSALPVHDRQVPLMSLPRILGTRLETIPCAVPYLAAPAEYLARWRKVVPQDGRKNVGLVWRGHRQPQIKDLRSASLEAFAPLAKVEGVRFFSLQMGGETAGFKGLVDHTGAIRNFADTAALVKQLDLVISIDTSVAHLAGALGVPIWLLVCCVPDFRWMLDRSDSPWYPTMRIFRQPTFEDWKTPVEEILGELRKWAAQ